MKDLDALFKHFLRDIYYAEQKIIKALPKMIEKADSTALSDAFTKHLRETEGQVETLDKVFALLDLKPKGETCPAINGILEEGEEIMKECEDPDACDAGMIAAAQAVEHYEITRYGTMVAWAKELGMPEAATHLQSILDQEYAADEALDRLAEGRLNREAA